MRRFYKSVSLAQFGKNFCLGKGKPCDFLPGAQEGCGVSEIDCWLEVMAISIRGHLHNYKTSKNRC